MFTQLTNGLITAKVNSKGAELTSLFNQALRLEYMWEANPRFWPKSSPILFPVVGALKDGIFEFNGQEYALPRHGFAREYQFETEVHGSTRATFTLRDSETSRKVYPFPFELRVIYELVEFELQVTYDVRNTGTDEMFFSIGGHPAFKVPLVAGTGYEDYYLKFDKKEDSARWLISPDGLIETRSKSLLQNNDVLALKKELFYEDALVFKDLKSSVISIRSHKHAHGLDFHFEGFPFFGIWAFRDADFVCLEPWCGIADGVNHNHKLQDKEGIIALPAGQNFRRTWSAKCY